MRLFAWANPDAVVPGSTVTFTVEVANTGGVPLEEVAVEGLVPKGVAPLTREGSPWIWDEPSRTLRWKVGSLALGEVRQASFPAQVEGQEGERLIQLVVATSPSLLQPVIADARVGLTGARLERAQVSREGGGALLSPDGRVSLIFPPGAVDRSVTVAYRERPDMRSPLLPVAFELLAWDDEGRYLEQFQAEVELTVRYDPKALSDYNPVAFRLFRYDPALQDWVPVPAHHDLDAHLFIAKLSHFSVYGAGASSYGLELFPSVEGFQTSLWTGDATFRLPIQMPPGPGGFMPSLALAYSTAAVNDMRIPADVGSAYKVQASWTGLGWDVAGLGVIARRLTSSYPYTVVLTLGGASFELEDLGDGRWATNPQEFWKIEHSGGVTSLDRWRVWTRDGTRYTFGNPNNTYGDGTAYMVPMNGCTKTGYQWHLTEILDVHGNKAVISYTHQLKTVANGCSPDSDRYTRATYPTEINIFPAGASSPTVRVVFERESRDDYRIDRYNDVYVRNFWGTDRLLRIKVEVKKDGVWQQAWRYDLGYTYTGDGDAKHSLMRTRRGFRTTPGALPTPAMW